MVTSVIKELTSQVKITATKGRTPLVDIQASRAMLNSLSHEWTVINHIISWLTHNETGLLFFSI